MASEPGPVDDLLALLHAWQEFAQHPCWAEWRQDLQTDFEVADQYLHEGVHPLDVVGFGVTRTQCSAIQAFMQYPEKRVAELKAHVVKVESGKESV